jgi:hypothetical protein
MNTLEDQLRDIASQLADRGWRVTVTATHVAGEQIAFTLGKRRAVWRGDLRSDLSAGIDEAIAFAIERGARVSLIAERFNISRNRVWQRWDRRQHVHRQLFKQLAPLLPALIAVSQDGADDGE